jgi:hypothetical protein
MTILDNLYDQMLTCREKTLIAEEALALQTAASQPPRPFKEEGEIQLEAKASSCPRPKGRI